LSTGRKRAKGSASVTRQKKLRSDGHFSTVPVVDENANDLQRTEPISEETTPTTTTIDYLSLEPERIVSITRSRLPNQQLEFLLKCTRCPSKLFFISNEKAKELIPDLLIQFYEKHINWLVERPSMVSSLRVKTSKRDSHSTHRSKS
jgi:hypothetical protein